MVTREEWSVSVVVTREGVECECFTLLGRGSCGYHVAHT